MRIQSYLGIPAVVLLLAACGATARATSVQTDTGSPVAVMLKQEKLDGHVVLVEFGMTGCPMSQAGLDSMAAWHTRNTVRGLAFLRLDPGRDKAALDKYYAAESLPFPVVRDTTLAVDKALGGSGFFQFLLLDKFGRVRFRGGQPSVADIAGWTAALAAETADAGPKAPLFRTTDAGTEGSAGYCGK